MLALARQAAAVPVAILLDRLQWRAPRAPAASVLRCCSLTGLLGCSGTARQRDSFNIARALAAHTWQTSVVRGFGAHLNTLRVFFPVHSFSWSSECLPALLNPLAEWTSLSQVRRGSSTCGSTTPKKAQLLPGHVLPPPDSLRSGANPCSAGLL